MQTQSQDKPTGPLRQFAFSFHGWSNGDKPGSPAWIYHLKQHIMMWFMFLLLNFIQSVQQHVAAFLRREREKQGECSTDLGCNLKLVMARADGFKFMYALPAAHCPLLRGKITYTHTEVVLTVCTMYAWGRLPK